MSRTRHYIITPRPMGAVRASVTGGRVEAGADYYPYGTPFADSRGLATATDRRLFGDKELMRFNSYNTYDYTARQYPAATATFDTPDPLCEQFYWMSPYSFCGGNPIARIDPSGMEWVNQSAADNLKNKVESQIDKNNKYIQQEASKAKKESTEKGFQKRLNKIYEYRRLNACLRQSVKTINDMTNDADNTYDIKYENNTEYSYIRQNGGTMQIVAADDAFAIHEITHIQQYRDNPEDFTFTSKGDENVLCLNARQYITDAKYETQAYKHQYAFNQRSLPSSDISVDVLVNVSPEYVAGIRNRDNVPVYTHVFKWVEYQNEHNYSTLLPFDYIDSIVK